MAPDETQHSPTETSPLLGAQVNAQIIDPSVGIAPAGVEDYNDTDVEEDNDEGDLERQPSNGETFKHQGLPEVKKRMKYIFPAIAIGVSKYHEPLNWAETKCDRSSSPLQTRPSSSLPTASLGLI